MLVVSAAGDLGFAVSLFRKDLTKGSLSFSFFHPLLLFFAYIYFFA
jgi:hypothetical protein